MCLGGKICTRKNFMWAEKFKCAKKIYDKLGKTLCATEGGGRSQKIHGRRTCPSSTTICSSGSDTTRGLFSTLIPNQVSELKMDGRLRRKRTPEILPQNFQDLHFCPIWVYFWILIQNPLSEFKNHAAFRSMSPFTSKWYTVSILSHAYHAINTLIFKDTYTYA